MDHVRVSVKRGITVSHLKSLKLASLAVLCRPGNAREPSETMSLLFSIGVQEAENRLENYKTKNWSSFENLRDRTTSKEVEAAAAIEAAEAGAWSHRSR